MPDALTRMSYEQLWDNRELSRHLNIKTSTLYAWAAQDKIPVVKIHGLIRFHPAEIHRWVESFRREPPSLMSPIRLRPQTADDIDAIIGRAKRDL